MDMLIAEDLMLLLLDDHDGTLAAASQIQVVLGGAVLLDLALREAVQVEEKESAWKSAKVSVTATEQLEDPLLHEALLTIAERPRSAQDLVTRLGKGQKDHLLQRLAQRELITAREEKVLGLFPTTRWPALDTRYEANLRERISGVLVHGLTPDERTGALVGLLHSVDQAHKVVDLQGQRPRDVKARAKQVAEGDWASKAVKDAIAASNAAVMAAITASTVITTTGSN